MKREDASLYEIIGAIYERHSAESMVQPSWMATLAMQEIGASREVNPSWYLAAHLQFRQIARSFCQKRFDPVENASDDLFPGTLQERYPRAPNSTTDEPVYVLQDQLVDADVIYNVARMRKTALSLMKHADALEAWAAHKFGKAA